MTPFKETDIAKKLAQYELPRYEQLGNFDVFMGQLTTILDKNLSVFLVQGEEKTLTPSMINNYVFNGIIEPPVKKLYNRRQIAHLLVIGILKQVLPVSTIGEMIKMQIKQYPIKYAYNFFCAELENALAVTFSTQETLVQNTARKPITVPLGESVHCALLSFANKIFVKQCVYYETHSKN